MNTDVLICGAGPTGLVLALWLVRLGVGVRIVDVAAEPGTTSRALVVHARTLEFYRQMGLAEALLQDGLRFAAVRAAGRACRAGRLRQESGRAGGLHGGHQGAKSRDSSTTEAGINMLNTPLTLTAPGSWCSRYVRGCMSSASTARSAPKPGQGRGDRFQLAFYEGPVVKPRRQIIIPPILAFSP